MKFFPNKRINMEPCPPYSGEEDSLVDKFNRLVQIQSNEVNYEDCEKQGKYFPVYVMLPLDTIILQNGIQYFARVKSLNSALQAFKKIGVEGVMIDVWWGYVENQPNHYDFSAYYALFKKIKDAGLKIQCVMSFHAAGANVGDTCSISLPEWVLEIGEQNKDIFFTNKRGWRDEECISIGCDELPLFYGRTAVQVYKDFIEAFCDGFQDEFFDGTISEITVGMGPAGELRYPSYPEGVENGWRFPGIGEFTCYDKYMLADLKKAAIAAGEPRWGNGGPDNSGTYNNSPYDTGFFHPDNGSWKSAYGNFFLTWYSNNLLQHCDRVLAAAHDVINQGHRPRVCRKRKRVQSGTLYEFTPAVKLGIKVAGIHWHYRVASHAAELTAGYYNVPRRDGYEPIMKVLRKYDAHMSFTCVEMRDSDHEREFNCSPECLLDQVISTAKKLGQPISGENALQRYDEAAFNRIAQQAFGQNAMKGRLDQLTFLRMSDMMGDTGNWFVFADFIAQMRNPPKDF